MEIKHVLAILSLLLLALWFGGFTFYAAIVVPVGTELIGTSEQGIITQTVTHWLNGIGGLSLIGLFYLAFIAYPHKGLKTCWVLLSLSWIGLLLVHPLLDAMIEPGSYALEDPSSFYTWHRFYLWIHTVQWIASIGFWWVFLSFILKYANR